jgi:hypothetical protein
VSTHWLLIFSNEGSLYRLNLHLILTGSPKEGPHSRQSIAPGVLYRRRGEYNGVLAQLGNLYHSTTSVYRSPRYERLGSELWTEKRRQEESLHIIQLQEEYGATCMNRIQSTTAIYLPVLDTGVNISKVCYHKLFDNMQLEFEINKLDTLSAIRA